MRNEIEILATLGRFASIKWSLRVRAQVNDAHKSSQIGSSLRSVQYSLRKNPAKTIVLIPNAEDAVESFSGIW